MKYLNNLTLSTETNPGDSNFYLLFVLNDFFQISSEEGLP